MKIQLCYNGDYPGYPCVKLNDVWATEDQERFLLELFGEGTLPEMFDMIGAKRPPGSEEHLNWVGTLSIAATAL